MMIDLEDKVISFNPHVPAELPLWHGSKSLIIILASCIDGAFNDFDGIHASSILCV